ncbi:MAG: (2Fe-2S)-binding protein [Alphaproteobacteria bacterium]|jgi:nicotinate dehydrogenase subunit A|nr:(2Fe-2S)-binding protein [Alphaproteobacteria bacterium]
METLTLTVNGEAREVACDPATPLLYILRNDLDLTGAKLGCGLEQCGACAVLIDGEATFCCNRPAGEVTGKEIVTVEALSADRTGAAVQRAFIAEGAAQCGYCTTGLVVAGTSLLKQNPTPDRDAIVAGLADHLCRCGSHARVIAAIARAAKDLTNG